MIARTISCPAIRFTPYSAKVVLVRCDLENLKGLNKSCHEYFRLDLFYFIKFYVMYID